MPFGHCVIWGALHTAPCPCQWHRLLSHTYIPSPDLKVEVCPAQGRSQGSASKGGLSRRYAQGSRVSTTPLGRLRVWPAGLACRTGYGPIDRSAPGRVRRATWPSRPEHWETSLRMEFRTISAPCNPKSIYAKHPYTQTPGVGVGAST